MFYIRNKLSVYIDWQFMVLIKSLMIFIPQIKKREYRFGGTPFYNL